MIENPITYGNHHDSSARDFIEECTGCNREIYMDEELPEVQEEMITAQQVSAIKLNRKKLATLRKVDEGMIKGHLGIKKNVEFSLKQAEKETIEKKRLKR